MQVSVNEALFLSQAGGDKSISDLKSANEQIQMSNKADGSSDGLAEKIAQDGLSHVEGKGAVAKKIARVGKFLQYRVEEWGKSRLVLIPVSSPSE